MWQQIDFEAYFLKDFIYTNNIYTYALNHSGEYIHIDTLGFRSSRLIIIGVQNLLKPSLDSSLLIIFELA